MVVEDSPCFQAFNLLAIGVQNSGAFLADYLIRHGEKSTVPRLISSRSVCLI